jgi:hypothetical protein
MDAQEICQKMLSPQPPSAWQNVDTRIAARLKPASATDPSMPEVVMSFIWLLAGLKHSRVAKPSAKAIPFLIDSQFKDNSLLTKPESFVDTTIVDQLERSRYIDSICK